MVVHAVASFERYMIPLDRPSLSDCLPQPHPAEPLEISKPRKQILLPNDCLERRKVKRRGGVAGGGVARGASEGGREGQVGSRVGERGERTGVERYGVRVGANG
jgi:hypothetical protein